MKAKRCEGLSGVSDASKTSSLVIAAYASGQGLSTQEQRLLAATVAGKVEKEIAASLRCTRSTLSTYWQRIFRKTGCRSQTQVVSAVLRWMVDEYVSATSGHDVRRVEREALVAP
jgi:DNA-binding CsgD family transcriptional regulator